MTENLLKESAACHEGEHVDCCGIFTAYPVREYCCCECHDGSVSHIDDEEAKS